MFKRTFIAIIFINIFSSAFAQTKISGKVTDEKKRAVVGANVYLKGTYDGTTTDADGNFSFTTDETGDVTFVVSLIGYEALEQKINLNEKEISVSPVLKESATELEAVVVSAGIFEASDEKKVTILKPLDIVTTAGAAGDIYGALQTLPGTQPIGETEGLFVRGGSAAETKTIIDGMIVQHPFYSSVPDISQRGRFSPFLFKGTVFSTGGYSALYGQAMSSALILDSQDLPDKTTSSITAMTVGVGAGNNHRWKDSSLGVYGSYTDLLPYYALIRQRHDWDRPPQAGGASVVFRQKTSPTGIFKLYSQYGLSRLALFYDDVNGGDYRFGLSNNNLYLNASYKEFLTKKWMLTTGASYSKDLNYINFETDIDTNVVSSNDVFLQGRLVLMRGYGKNSTLKIGGEIIRANDFGSYNQYISSADEKLTAEFIETDFYFTSKLVARIGGRAEHSELMKKNNFSPRTSLAYKTGKKSQVSFAYGDFYQSPEDQFLYEKKDLVFEKATHYILNYQFVDEKRTFRIEGYYKNYDDLVRKLSDSYGALDNSGYGYAQGVDVFWRDKKTFKMVDYWISYSYLDTKRLYRDFPSEATPTFAANHTLSIVYKQWIPKITSSFGFTYTFASGRPYFNPNNTEFLGDRTISYHNLSVSGSYLTSIKGNFTVIAFGLGNILGFDNVYGYRYSYDGTKSAPIKAAALRTFFVGMFISIGEDADNS